MRTKERTIRFSVLACPVVLITGLAVLIFLFPERARATIALLSDIFVNRLGVFYILVGLFILGGCLFLAFSKYGRIRLGKEGEKPAYSGFQWGTMIFTSTMAADILYWSLIEWSVYYPANPLGLSEVSKAQQLQYASSYTLFHWGAIPWAFYILPSVAYAYLFYVKMRQRQTMSEACRPLLKKKVDGPLGNAIDIFAILGLLCGTATTFSLATPMMAEAFGTAFGFQASKGLTIAILLCIGLLFTVVVMSGMKAVSKLSVVCVYLFGALALYVFFAGPTGFIIESGISGIGYMAQNFLQMSTWTDPLRLTGDGTLGFPQAQTIFYWAYWIAWFVATPFFIAKISRGRTIRQLVLGAFFYGLSGTFTSFIVFGNFGLYQQATGRVDAVAMLAAGEAPAAVIPKLFSQLPGTSFVLVLLVVTMVAFYATTFDAITLVVAGFCQKSILLDGMPKKNLRAFWSLVFILLPIALISADSTVGMLQTVSIVAAFPLSLIMLIIVIGFFRELRRTPVPAAGEKAPGPVQPGGKAGQITLPKTSP